MFDLNKSVVAISAAMVSTIRNTDDANRFATRANAEGFPSISMFIASEALKQSLANEATIAKYREANPSQVDLIGKAQCATEIKLGEATTLNDVLDDPIALAHRATETLTDFAGKGPEVFANTATATATTTNSAALGGGNPAGIAPNDNPLPPIVPPVTAPVVTTSTNTTSVTATPVVELDSEGLPWDGRIHSSSKEKLVKGATWKLKRGVDKALVEQVKTELRAAMAIPAVSAEPLAPAQPQATEALHPNGNPFSTSTVNNLIAAGNGAQPAAATAPASVGPIDTFAKLMPAITKAKLDPAFVTAVVQQFGLPSMPVLATRPDLIPQVAEALGLV